MDIEQIELFDDKQLELKLFTHLTEIKQDKYDKSSVGSKDKTN